MQFGKIFKIKEGKLEKVKEWFNTLNTTRRQEAISTFDYEDVTREVFVLFKGTDGAYYIVGLNEAGSNYKKGDLTVTINQEHNAIKKECFEPITDPGEILMDLQK